MSRASSQYNDRAPRYSAVLPEQEAAAKCFRESRRAELSESIHNMKVLAFRVSLIVKEPKILIVIGSPTDLLVASLAPSTLTKTNLNTCLRGTASS